MWKNTSIPNFSYFLNGKTRVDDTEATYYIQFDFRMLSKNYRGRGTSTLEKF